MFRRATVRLALSIAAVQLVLFAAFGAGIYLYVTTAFDFDVAERDASAVSAESAFATLRAGILIAYLALVIVVPVSSYALASLAMRPLRASYAAQQRFVDDASHEFRTPLGALQAQLELGLSRPRDPAEYRTILGHSLRASAQLVTVLDDLTALSRGPRDSQISRRDVDVSTLVDDAIAQLPPGEAARLHITGSTDAVVRVSSTMITRAIVNLLTNALRYSEPGSEVRVSTARRPNWVRVSVEDAGVGMTREQRAHAFDRFWRADDSRSSEGRGLGLAIVKEIARTHGAKVDLISHLGVGTTIWIDLPLSR